MHWHYYHNLLLTKNLYSAISLKISNVLHALYQYVAKRKHLRERLKVSKVSVSSLRNAGRLFHAEGPVQENALLLAVVCL